MKRIIIIFLSITFILLMLLVYITNDNYYNNISKSIKDNYANINLYYVNKYNDYYIFLSDENYGVLDGEYNEIMLISKSLVHDNTNNYDVIYKDNKLIYQEEVLDKDKLMINYYDIYTYQLDKTITMGENNGK
ncbi:MAG: hypothetical protein SO067_01605 [Bacilli bacterium]|jgi:hypothetical protein|nr:hypothetical protein [Clostridium sp.]MDY3797801.1 hypothetical protein [Bacilli bacterium]CDE95825.1 unknown [Clostridium sp. CAG:914]